MEFLQQGSFGTPCTFLYKNTQHQEGPAVEVANHRAMHEYRRKISSQRKGPFFDHIWVLLPPCGLGVVSADVSVSEIGGSFRGK